jgi:hypothetical protein
MNEWKDGWTRDVDAGEEKNAEREAYVDLITVAEA